MNEWWRQSLGRKRREKEAAAADSRSTANVRLRRLFPERQLRAFRGRMRRERGKAKGEKRRAPNGLLPPPGATNWHIHQQQHSLTHLLYFTPLSFIFDTAARRHNLRDFCNPWGGTEAEEDEEEDEQGEEAMEVKVEEMNERMKNNNEKEIRRERLDRSIRAKNGQR